MKSFCLNFKIPSIALLLALAACDDGHVDDPVFVDDTKFYTVRVVASLSGQDDWDDSFAPVLAGYDDESEYSLIQKNLLRSATGQADTITLNRIPTSVTSVQIAVANVLRQRQATIFAYEIPEGQDPDEVMTLELGSVDVSRFGAVNAAVFQGLSCFRCHQGDAPPAGLALTPDEAYSRLVGEPSAKSPSQVLVVPGDADNSFLVKVLSEGDDNVHYDHRPFFVEQGRQQLLELIKAWVDNIEE